MKRISESLKDPADHLALDDAALLLADAGELPETLRVWEFAKPVVVIGRSTKVDYEVNRELCEARGLPILRRCSGGASIVGGPGCLMYSAVIHLQRHGDLRNIDAAHKFVISRVLTAVQQQVPDAALQGICDLTYQNRKFSGNSLRISRTHLLYHGTILYAADLDLLADCLTAAPRQPDYRDGRGHHDFVTNAPLRADGLSVDLFAQFNVTDAETIALPSDEIKRLRSERYDNPAWHFRH